MPPIDGLIIFFFFNIFYRFVGHCRLQIEIDLGINMDVDFALFHIDADVGRRVRRRASAERKRSDAKTKVRAIEKLKKTQIY